MKLIEFNRQPTERQLQQFGVLCLCVLPTVGWMWGASTATIAVLILVGLGLAIAGLALPTAVKPVFLAISLVTTPIGIVLGELAMLTIFFGIFLPFGLVFRIARRDPLQRKLDKNRPSYWQAKKQPTDVSSYYRQS